MIDAKKAVEAALKNTETTVPGKEEAVDEKIKDKFKSQYIQAVTVKKIDRRNSEVYLDLTQITFIDGFEVVNYLKNELRMDDKDIADLPGFGGRYDPIGFGAIGGYMAYRYDVMQNDEILMPSRDSKVSLVTNSNDGQIANKNFTYEEFVGFLDGKLDNEDLYLKNDHFSGGASIELDSQQNIIYIKEWYKE